MNYRTIFVIFGMIHRRVIFFMKCHFLQFWWAVRELFSQLSELAFRLLLPFATTHLCESDFSALVVIQMKARNHRKVEHDKRLVVTTANTPPRISKLPYGCTVNHCIENICEIQLPFESNCYNMHFCGSNVVVVRCILQEMRFVVIIMVIISNVLKQDQERSQVVWTYKRESRTENGWETLHALEGTALR